MLQFTLIPVPLFDCSTVCFCLLLLVDFWFVFRFSLLQTVLLWVFSNPFLGATWTSVSPENNSHALFYCTLLFCASQICIFFYKLKLCDNSALSDDGLAFLAIKYFYFIYLSVFGCAESSFWHRGSGALGLCSFSTLALVAPRHVGSSLTREQIPVPCVGRRILNHWTIRAVPEVFLKYVWIFFLSCCTLNRLQYSINITFICTGKPKNSFESLLLWCLLYAVFGLKLSPRCLWYMSV